MRLSTQKLKSVRRRIDNVLYGFGINVALKEAERRPRYIKFVNSMSKALLWQVREIVKPDNFERLMQVRKYKQSGNRIILEVTESLLTDLTLLMALGAVGEDPNEFLVWSANVGGQAAIDKLLVDAVFDLTDPTWLKFIKNSENLLIMSVDDTTKRWIAGVITEGVENQLTTSEIADLLVTEAKGISKNRALTIARTELANAAGKTELENYRRSGFTEKRWKTASDERVCPWCGPLDNVVVGIQGAFDSVAKGKIMTGQTPPLHPQCRCIIQAVVVEQPTDVWLGD